MKFLIVLLTTLLVLPTATVARASLGNRLPRRPGNARLSHPNQRVDAPANRTRPTSKTCTTRMQYSSNWAGAGFDSTPAGTFQAVTATFVVPMPTAHTDYGTYASAVFVGIDGDTCSSANLWVGIDFTVTGGQVTFDAWYEWWPDYFGYFYGITVEAGDTVTATVIASSTYTGVAILENLTRNQIAFESLSSSSRLCQSNAVWIVSDEYDEYGYPIPFANIGTVVFNNAIALTGSTSVGPRGATVFDIVQNNLVLTSSSYSSSSVTVSCCTNS